MNSDKKSIGELKINVDTTELDAAIQKAERLVELLGKADVLSTPQAEVNDTRLPPPSLYDRLMAMIADDSEMYSTLYYQRKEGATSAVFQVAKQLGGRLAVTSVNAMKNYFRNEGVTFINPDQPQYNLEGHGIKIVIADTFPSTKLRNLKRDLLEQGIRLIVIKSFPRERH